MNVAKDYKDQVIVRHKSFMMISSIEDLKDIAPTIEEARELFKNEFSILKKYIPDYDPKSVFPTYFLYIEFYYKLHYIIYT